jgi:hypothetical protein
MWLSLPVLPKLIPLVLLELLKFFEALGQAARGVKMGKFRWAHHGNKIVELALKSELRGGLLVFFPESPHVEGNEIRRSTG